MPMPGQGIHDVNEDPAPRDDRLIRFKSIYSRMGQKLVNDTFGKCGNVVFNKDLFSSEANEKVDMETVDERVTRKEKERREKRKKDQKATQRALNIEM